MRTVAMSQFKTHPLKILDQVVKNSEAIIVTKRGKPLVQIIPYPQEEPRVAEPGRLAGTLVCEEDIVSPLGEEM